MPIIKTEVEVRTRASVAYVAAMLGLSESEIYGSLLNAAVGGQTLDDLVRHISDTIKKGEVTIDPGSQDTQ